MANQTCDSGMVCDEEPTRIFFDTPEDMLNPLSINPSFLPIVITHAIIFLVGIIGNTVVIVTWAGSKPARSLSFRENSLGHGSVRNEHLNYLISLDSCYQHAVHGFVERVLVSSKKPVHPSILKSLMLLFFLSPTISERGWITVSSVIKTPSFNLASDDLGT
ncbi:hypothetical protein AVEN_273615-1 [Araneus ventricosus]|uniref:Uncharacterized protein n=1 Tax=Araneus ventricosus TaxID=182803 RepID=A0A4Y2JXF4_ARAVE|nr:hypothetical protein AVEN_273615-1 [Araneus ventricosus]